MSEIINNRNLTQQLTHDLGSAIVQHKYSNSNPIPSEADICEMYSVSRSATREAVKILSAKGLISSRPRKGISIKPQNTWNLFDADVLRWLLGGTPTLTTLRHFMELRQSIEPAACALAATYATKEQVATIAHALARMQNAMLGLDDTLEPKFIS